MNTQEILEKCTTFIGDNKIAAAIELLEENFKDSDYFSEIVQQKSKWSQLQKQERLSILSFSEASSERNRIVYALLGLIGAIKKGQTTPKEPTKDAPPTNQTINIINSKNVNTGNVNTNGGDFKIGDGH